MHNNKKIWFSTKQANPRFLKILEKLITMKSENNSENLMTYFEKSI